MNILFKAKTLEGEWVEGSLVTHNDGEMSIIDYADFQGESYTWHDIDPKTLGQYIGKEDEKGIKIFSGDIVKSHCKTFTVEMKEYSNGMLAWNVRRANGHEIIGNIHNK